jgi:hypothetical protein
MTPLAWGYLQLIAVQDGGELDFVKSGSHADLRDQIKQDARPKGL